MLRWSYKVFACVGIYNIPRKFLYKYMYIQSNCLHLIVMLHSIT